MDNLPTEIYHAIFICLSLEERIKCRLICRHWKAILDSSSLLYNVEIRDRAFYSRFMTLIERSPFLRAQVEILKIKDSIPPEFDKRRFYIMFPNLRVLKLKNFMGKRVTFLNGTPFVSTRTMSKMEKLAEYGHCELARHLITSHQCSRLRSLRLEFNDVWQQNNDFISLLANMPVLEKLSISDFEIKISDFETLHKNVPGIKYLDLSGVGLVESDMPINIQPATQLLKLKMYVMENTPLDLYERWYQYMGQKYTHLTDFDCADEDLVYRKPDISEQMHTRGLAPFFKKTGSTLRNINLSEASYDIDLFKILDSTGCKLETLDIGAPSADVPIFQRIGQSRQAASIKDLLLSGMDIYPVNLMENFMALKKLVIEFTCGNQNVNVDLLELLKRCPNTLEELQFIDVALECHHSPTQINTFIKTLVLRDVEQSENLESILATAFPNLTYLHMGCEIEQDLTIMLPNNHMSEVGIFDSEYITDGCNVAITTTEDSNTRYYTKGSNPSGPKFLPVTLEKLPDIPLVKLVCASIKQFSFDDDDFTLLL